MGLFMTMRPKSQTSCLSLSAKRCRPRRSLRLWRGGTTSTFPPSTSTTKSLAGIWCAIRGISGMSSKRSNSTRYSIHLTQNYISTSFFIVFDHKASQTGASPYKAYRLKDEFAVKTSFQWSELQNCSLKQMNPFVQIPIEVKKTELFEALMYMNKPKLLDEFETNRKKNAEQNKKSQVLKQNM